MAPLTKFLLYTHEEQSLILSTHIKNNQKWCICLQLCPGRWRQEHLWCSLASHPSLICKPHIPVTDPVSKQVDSFWGTILEADPWYSVTQHIPSPLHRYTLLHTQFLSRPVRCVFGFSPNVLHQNFILTPSLPVHIPVLVRQMSRHDTGQCGTSMGKDGDQATLEISCPIPGTWSVIATFWSLK